MGADGSSDEKLLILIPRFSANLTAVKANITITKGAVFCNHLLSSNTYVNALDTSNLMICRE